MKLSLGFSPCPNDTFIFDALVNGAIDTEGLEFEPVLADVEQLNQWAQEGRLDITKLSFPALFQSLENYTLLHAGSALGKGVGPLLIAAQPFSIDSIEHSRVAIPGEHTTANLLLQFAFPGVTRKFPMLFSEIEDAVLNGQVDLGVIIHENRFTYQDKGLHCIADLGRVWEDKMHLPLPLGGIAINQSVKRQVALQVDGLIRKSLEHAFAQYPFISPYVRSYAQTMSEEVMRQHIDLYVNNYSIDLGEMGKQAIREMQKVYGSLYPSAEPEDLLFL